ncbi:hypothetical protein OG389_20030 [Streptomyces sp. NBC_00435]|uniref:hypothetical protein n=1 Tax=Streptomyces sp. NBC_00435 TaxID=2903649 RepID=UPI002E238AAF
MSRTSLRTKLAAMAATGVMALGTGVLAASPAEASNQPVGGCLSGEACIWPQDSPVAGVAPTHHFSRAGSYNLSGQEGWHWVLNNQTKNWKFKLCTGWNGGGTCTSMPIDEFVPVDLHPINSVVISS